MTAMDRDRSPIIGSSQFTEDELTMLLAAIAVAQGDDEWPDGDADLKALRSAERKVSAAMQRVIDKMANPRDISSDPALPIGEEAWHAHDGLGLHPASERHISSDPVDDITIAAIQREAVDAFIRDELPELLTRAMPDAHEDVPPEIAAKIRETALLEGKTDE